MSADYKPCADPKNNPNDWFIERDGKQYPDDPMIPDEQREDIRQAVIDTFGEDDPDLTARIDEAVDLAEEYAKKDALRRRRHARDACHVECYFRLQCLGLALGDGEGPVDVDFGIRGGYYPEELRQIVRVRDARKSE